MPRSQTNSASEYFRGWCAQPGRKNSFKFIHDRNFLKFNVGPCSFHSVPVTREFQPAKNKEVLEFFARSSLFVRSPRPRSVSPAARGRGPRPVATASLLFSAFVSTLAFTALLNLSRPPVRPAAGEEFLGGGGARGASRAAPAKKKFRLKCG